MTWDPWTSRHTRQTRNAARETTSTLDALLAEQRRTNALLERIADAVDPRTHPAVAAAQASNPWRTFEKR